MRRVRQISFSHCGPAVIVMLLSYQGIRAYQRDIVAAAGVGYKLKTHGMTVPELALAVKHIAPQVQFWWKEHASLNDLKEITTTHNHPVGVEWQGVFEEYADDDDGHYAIVTHIDTINNEIIMADPFKKYAGTDRHFAVTFFEGRWWDTNEVIDPITRHREVKKDDHMLFIITPKEAVFPETLGMQRG